MDSAGDFTPCCWKSRTNWERPEPAARGGDGYAIIEPAGSPLTLDHDWSEGNQRTNCAVHDAETIDGIVNGDLFSRYSKDPNLQYDNTRRLQDRESLRTHLESELAEARQWLEAAAARLAALARSQPDRQAAHLVRRRRLLHTADPGPVLRQRSPGTGRQTAAQPGEPQAGVLRYSEAKRRSRGFFQPAPIFVATRCGPPTVWREPQFV